MRYSDNNSSLLSSPPLLLGTHSPDMYPTHFISDIQSRIQAVQKNPLTQAALILISIDNLAMILSGYGHEAAEKTFATLLQRLNDLLDKEDHATRLQKDQIAIVVSAENSVTIRTVAERIQHIVEHCGYDNDQESLYLQHSVACISITPQCLHAEQLLNFGFVALREALHTPHILYKPYEQSPIDSAKARQEMGLANYLQRGLREQRLRMAYQPVIRSCDGHIAHYEALLRVISDDGSISSAGPLIPIAERMGLIHTIDDMVMRKVIEEIEHAPEVKIAFNVSTITTESKQWLNSFQKLLLGKPEVAQRVMVEITETAIHHDLKSAAYFVAAVQATGAQVALDDFGAGYTSFRQLKALSVDVVKIDGAYIRDIAENSDNRFFVRTLLDCVHGFGLTAVAEFVENGEVAKILMEMGVDYMQGYYFGKPENHRSWRTE
jgi:diguanylate cyclase (GGDEF)-like protein